MATTTTRSTDTKGRLQLGPRYANKTFIIEEINESEVRLTEAVVIPKRELWLHQNADAKAAVARGLEDAREGRFAETPDLDADAAGFDDE